MKKISVILSFLICLNLIKIVHAQKNQTINLDQLPEIFGDVEALDLPIAQLNNLSDAVTTIIINSVTENGIYLTLREEVEAGKQIEVFVDYCGNAITIEPDNKALSEFQDGLARVEYDSNWGFVNYAYEWIVPPIFEKASVFSDGYAIVRKDGKQYILDTHGKMRYELPGEAFVPHSFDNGILPINFLDGYGYLDTCLRLHKLNEFVPDLWLSAQNGILMLADECFEGDNGGRIVHQASLYKLNEKGDDISNLQIPISKKYAEIQVLENDIIIIANKNAADDGEVVIYKDDGRELKRFPGFDPVSVFQGYQEYIWHNWENHLYNLDTGTEIELNDEKKYLSYVENGICVFIAYENEENSNNHFISLKQIKVMTQKEKKLNYLPHIVDMEKIKPYNKSSEIAILLNGQQLDFDVEPQKEKDRVLVPLRTIFEALGAEVEWNEERQQVTAKRGEITIQLTIGEKNMQRNDELIELDVPAKLVKDRTLIPIRAVAEAFGAAVEWNEVTQTVIIETI